MEGRSLRCLIENRGCVTGHGGLPPSRWGGALAAALVPQTADAALVTVGGDGGTGTVTLEDRGDRTALGGLLTRSLRLPFVGSNSGIAFDSQAAGVLHPAIRSSVSGFGDAVGWVWTFAQVGGPAEGAVFGSDDNWVPGQFRVNGVNNGDFIWGWLRFRLGPGPGSFNPTILSFTYDDEATDATPFAKPIGGFSVPETDPVPEPGTLGLLGFGLGAAFVSRMRRRRSADR